MDLERVLSGERSHMGVTGVIYVAVEGVYSMEGDVAPLRAMCDVALKYGACLLVDEAHR